jgi:haloalkane dehalogenase
VVNELYPYAGRTLSRNGLKLHYLDEGSGHPIVMLHGNPTWSFFYRNLILGLRDRYRCLALDHQGCGLSDRPTLEQYDFSLQSRIDDLDFFLDSMSLTEPITLIVHDWGGMIGFAWAVRNPARIRRLIVLNTGAFHLPSSKPLPWSLWLGRNTRFGAWLIRSRNYFCKKAIKWCVKRKPLSEEIKRGYLEPYDTPEKRLAVLKFVQTIPLKESDPGFDRVTEVETHLNSLIDKPMLIAWGMKDFVFDEHFLNEWQRRFPQAEVHRFPDCGHYLLEDAPEEVLQLVREFLGRN